MALPAHHVLRARELRRRFGSREVLNGLNLQLEAGERLALTGPNGSGKTTTLRCVAGTLAPSSGEVEIEGHPAGSLEARRCVGTSLSQERSFYLRLSGTDNLRFFAALRFSRSADARQQVRRLVEELEIEDIAAERLDRCSTGMVQQLALARALLGEPALLVLDEPTRSLDTVAVDRLWAAIERRSSLAVLIATHRSDDVERCHSQIDLGR